MWGGDLSIDIICYIKDIKDSILWCLWYFNFIKGETKVTVAKHHRSSED